MKFYYPALCLLLVTVVCSSLFASDSRGHAQVAPTRTPGAEPGSFRSYLPRVTSPESVSVTATIPVDGVPYGLAANTATNAIYATLRESNGVAVADGKNNVVVATVPVGRKPYSVAVNPVTNRIYVGNQEDATISVIDGATNRVIDIVSIGFVPGDIAVDFLRNRIFVASFDSNQVKVFDGMTGQVTFTYLVGSASAPSPAGASRMTVSVDPVTGQVYIGDQSSRSISIFPVASAVPSQLTVGSGPVRIFVEPLTKYFYAVSGTETTVAYVPDPRFPVTLKLGGSAVAANPATGRAFIAESVVSEQASAVVSLWELGDFYNPERKFAFPTSSRAIGSLAVNSTASRIYLGLSSSILVLQDFRKRY